MNDAIPWPHSTVYSAAALKPRLDSARKLQAMLQALSP
jgi:hypothetical protein